MARKSETSPEQLIHELKKWIEKKLRTGKTGKFKPVLPLAYADGTIKVGIAVLESQRTGRPFPCVMIRIKTSQVEQDFVIPFRIYEYIDYAIKSLPEDLRKALLKLADEYKTIRRLRAEEEEEEEDEEEEAEGEE